MAKRSTALEERVRTQLRIQKLHPDLIRQYTTTYCQHCRYFIYARCYHLLLPVTLQGDPCPYYELKTTK